MSGPERLNEAYAPFALWGLLVFGAFLAGVGILCLTENLPVLGGFFLAAAAILAALAFRTRKWRIIMDETGVRCWHFGREIILPWATIRTAAVKTDRLRLPRLPRLPVRMVYLSTLPPEQALKQLGPLDDPIPAEKLLKLPYTAARRACAEHHLHMKLPDIRL